MAWHSIGHRHILAFGQTASGKTHTIHGDAAAPGIVPRALQLLLAASRRTEGESTRVTLSFVECYNERLYDLLEVCAECGPSPDPNHALCRVAASRM